MVLWMNSTRQVLVPEAGVMFALKCHWWMRSMRMMLCSMAMIPGEITRKIKEHSL